MLDLVLTGVPGVVVVRVGSPVGTSNDSVVFRDVVLEQPGPHQVCRQEVYLKTSVDCELARVDVNGLTRNGIIRSPCAV